MQKELIGGGSRERTARRPLTSSVSATTVPALNEPAASSHAALPSGGPFLLDRHLLPVAAAAVEVVPAVAVADVMLLQTSRLHHLRQLLMI